MSWNAKLLPRVLAHDIQWIWNTAGEHSPQCPESLYDGSLYLPVTVRNLCDLRCDSLENIRTLESITTSPLGIFHIWPVATFNLFTTFFVASALGLYVIASQGSFFLVNVATVALFWYDKHQAPFFFSKSPSKTQGKKDFLNSPFQASRGLKELFGVAVFLLSVRVFWKCLSMLPALVLACLFVFCICFVYVSWSFLLLYITYIVNFR